MDVARASLKRTTALQIDAGAPVAIDDGAVADRITTSDASIDAAIADLDLLIAATARTPALDPAAADARLRRLAGEHRAREAQVSLPDLIARWLSRALSGVRGAPPDPRIVLTVAGGLGLAVLLLVAGILGRDLRERVRREVLLPDMRAARAPEAGAHLRAADAALHAGHRRDAIHGLYLYAIAALAARESVRYDPSLTDREFLARAAAIPHADALRDLVELHDRVWYGLHDAAAGDADRARALALRAAA